MDILEAMRARYSVRQYTTQPLSAAQVQRLQEEIDTNREIRLHVQLIKDEWKASVHAKRRCHDRNKKNEVGRDMRVS